MLTSTLLVALCLAPSQAAAPSQLTIRDTIGKDWHREPIAWDLELAPGHWDGKGGILLRRDGQPIPAQATVRTRHNDGSAKSVVVRFLIDQLARDATTALTCDFGKPGPAKTDLKIDKGAGFLILANAHTAVKLPDHAQGQAAARTFSPILGVRTASGQWTDGGDYDTQNARPSRSETVLLETGPVRLAARVTTTFDNGRTHIVTVSLLADAHVIDIEESFNLGPDDKYQFKSYKTDQDELAWEWWSWYGDVGGTAETHPNNWIVPLSSAGFRPVQVRYRGQSSTDKDKGNTKGGGESSYALSFTAKERLEKYLAGQSQWRPDSVTWYAAGNGDQPNDDVVGVFTHSVRNWRNPNVYPLATGITLRTGTNDMRILSRAEGHQLLVQCPIGLGSRSWGIRVSRVAETFQKTDQSPTALSAAIVQRNLGLDVTRHWITDWKMTLDYPRLFVKPAERDAYYARYQGKGVGLPGQPIDTFLRTQTADSFRKFYANALAQADRMIDGWFSLGTDNTTNYPGWMLGYWHGTIVAGDLDSLAGSPHATPEMVRALKKKLAVMTYCLTSKDAWPDKQINYGWGSMNMPVGRWGGLVVMAAANSEHPMAKTWLKDAGRYFRMLLQTEYSPDGVHISCPHYIGASMTSFYAWIIMANNGLGEDVSGSPQLQRFARYYAQLMTPIDPRWGIRTLLTEGDGRPGSSPLPGVLATLFRKSNPELAGQLMQVWIEGGRDLSSGMGIADGLIIDPTVPVRKPRFGPEVFPGFGAVLRYREPGTPEEAYLSLLGGNFMIDHTNADQLAFSWYEKGVPLSLYMGDMYVPGAVSALSHNMLSWNVRPEGPPTPGKDKPGDWYHDNHLPWVDHTRRPRLHWQIGHDPLKQKITDTRGQIVRAADLEGAALLEGQVTTHALAEVPTRADYSIAMQAHQPLPRRQLDVPATWTRRLLYVKDRTAAGLNYLVIRDQVAGLPEDTPSFSYWALADDVELAERSAHFKGQLKVDTDLFVLSPASVKLFKDSFTHNQCEPIVSARTKGAFREKQVLARVEGQKGQGFLVVIFPRRTDEARPTVASWADGKGVKVSWQGQTHYLLLDMQAQRIEADGIQADASCLVVKTKEGQPTVVSLPAGGQASYRGQKLSGAGPVEGVSVNGKLESKAGNDLLADRAGKIPGKP